MSNIFDILEDRGLYNDVSASKVNIMSISHNQNGYLATKFSVLWVDQQQKTSLGRGKLLQLLVKKGCYMIVT